MSRRVPFNPFEDLNDFPDLKSLTRHILESVEVKEVLVVFPGLFDTGLIRTPRPLLPVDGINILVGNATFSYIQNKAEDIVTSVKERIEKINQNSLLSFTDRFTLYKEVK